MTRSCCAFGCSNRDTKESRLKGIKFYRIPVGKEKRQKWLKAINRKDFDPPPDACICSVHFVGGTLAIHSVRGLGLIFYFVCTRECCLLVVCTKLCNVYKGMYTNIHVVVKIN